MQNKISKSEVDILSANPYVKWVTETGIKFTDDFKERFIEEYYNLGKKPTEIFQRAGFDPDVVGRKRIERCAANWRKSYEAGKLLEADAKERALAEKLVAAESVIRANEQEIEQLRAEVELLKKALRIGRRRCDGKVYGKPDLVTLIDETIAVTGVRGGIRRLCRAVGMTPQDYYYRKQKTI